MPSIAIHEDLRFDARIDCILSPYTHYNEKIYNVIAQQYVNMHHGKCNQTVSSSASLTNTAAIEVIKLLLYYNEIYV